MLRRVALRWKAVLLRVNLLLLGIPERRTARAGLSSSESRGEILVRLGHHLLLIVDLVSALPCISTKTCRPATAATASPSAAASAASAPWTTARWHTDGATRYRRTRVLHVAIVWLHKRRLPWLLRVGLVVLLLLLLRGRLCL